MLEKSDDQHHERDQDQWHHFPIDVFHGGLRFCGDEAAQQNAEDEHGDAVGQEVCHHFQKWRSFSERDWFEQIGDPYQPQ